MAIAVVPELRGARQVEPLGGITNVNFKVESPVARSSSAWTLPTRTTSRSTGPASWPICEAASLAGVGAPVVARLPEEHVLVTRFLDGRRLTPEDLRRGDRLEELAALLRRLHDGCRFRGEIDMFRRQRDYQAMRWPAAASFPRATSATSGT